MNDHVETKIQTIVHIFGAKEDNKSWWL